MELANVPGHTLDCHWRAECQIGCAGGDASPRPVTEIRELNVALSPVFTRGSYDQLIVWCKTENLNLN